jgi:uncharacterized membrane protein
MELVSDFLIGSVSGAVWESIALDDPNGMPDFALFRPVYGLGAMVSRTLSGSFINRFVTALIEVVILEEIAGRVCAKIGCAQWDYSSHGDALTRYVRVSYSLIFALCMTIYSYIPAKNRAIAVLAALAISLLFRAYRYRRIHGCTNS